ncbi:hypothetical protein [Aminobacter phage Erebus]|nr:hypothetical protein [Aminobacter phage Erebus]
MNVNATNAADRTLILPNQQQINPGETALVKAWNKMESHPVVEAWVNGGALVISDADNADEPADDITSDKPVDVAQIDSDDDKGAPASADPEPVKVEDPAPEPEAKPANPFAKAKK